jgi:hypothetical protein
VTGTALSVNQNNPGTVAWLVTGIKAQGAIAGSQTDYLGALTVKDSSGNLQLQNLLPLSGFGNVQVDINAQTVGNIAVAEQGTPTVKPDPGITTFLNSARVTSPGGLAEIARVTPGVIGGFQLTATVGVFGTTATSDLSNTALDKNGSSVSDLPNPTGSVVQLGPYRVNTAATTDYFRVTSHNAGTVGSVYVAGLALVQTK